MPKTHLAEDYFDQEWEPVVLEGGRSVGANVAPPTFGGQLIEARRLAQETRLRVAQGVGVPVSAVESWENNETRPTKSQIVRLNRVLRCVKKLK